MADEKYIVKIEGQEIAVGKEIGGLDDNALKRALTPMFPGAANSRISRTSKDGVTTIEIIKVAGSKGAGGKKQKNKKGGGFAALCSCQSRRNPMVELFLSLNTEDLNNLDPTQLIGFSDDVEKVVDEGRRQLNQVVAAHTRLTNTVAKDGTSFVPLGF